MLSVKSLSVSVPQFVLAVVIPFVVSTTCSFWMLSRQADSPMPQQTPADINEHLFKHEHPDPHEWLRVDLWHRLNLILSTFETRISVNIAFDEDSKSVLVGIAKAKGVPPFDEVDRRTLPQLLHPTAEKVLEEHPFFQGWRIVVRVKPNSGW